MSLYKHIPHEHKPRNVNEVHASEHTSLNARIAVTLTKSVGTMICAYLFALVGVGSLVGIFTGNLFLGLLFGSISSYFLQLVLLPVIMVGQNVESRRSELLVEEMHATTLHSFHDIEGIMKHLDAQDEKILAILEKLQAQKKPRPYERG